MAAPIKIGRALAALILDDLPHSIAEMAQEYGVKPPQVALKFGDRLSRAEANTLYNWAIGNPDFHYALRTPSNPAHGIARGFFDLLNFFLHDFPHGANGEPAEWPEPLSPAIGGLIAGSRAKISASEMTSREARDFLSWAQMQPDFREALYDRRNADHAEIVQEFQDLHARAFSDGAAASEGSAPMTASNTPSSSPAHETVQARIAEIRAHPGFRDRGHPEHRGLIAELGDLLAGGSAGMAGTAAPPAAAASRISAAAATPQPSAPAAPGAAPPPANRAAELVQLLRGNRLYGSADRRAALAELEAELLAGDSAGGGTAPPTGG